MLIFYYVYMFMFIKKYIKQYPLNMIDNYMERTGDL